MAISGGAEDNSSHPFTLLQSVIKLRILQTVALNNRDLNIGQNNLDYAFGHNLAALTSKLNKH